ncbi:MAG: alpha/beta hydrolase [Zestosphaera sp.]
MKSLKPLIRARFFKAVLALTLTLLILYIVPVPTVGEPVEDLAQGWGKFVEIDGVKIHYVEDYGGGNLTFVLLHGFGASVFSWREVLKPLSNYGRVIAFDRPGFGLSERVDPAKAGFNPYTAEGQVELTYRLFGKLNVSKAVLIGHSAGGGVAILFTLNYPELVEALVLVAPAWKPSRNSLHETLLYSIPLSEKYGPLVVRGFIGQLEQILYRAWYDKSKLTEDVLEGYKYPLRAKDWDKGLYWLMKYKGFPDIRDGIGNLETPTLIIHGLNDEIVNLSNSLELASLLNPAAHHKLVVMDECGHLPHEEKPDEFIQTLEEFIVNLRVSA